LLPSRLMRRASEAVTYSRCVRDCYLRVLPSVPLAAPWAHPPRRRLTSELQRSTAQNVLALREVRFSLFDNRDAVTDRDMALAAPEWGGGSGETRHASIRTCGASCRDTSG
jgi:hypothetical protein